MADDNWTIPVEEIPVGYDHDIPVTVVNKSGSVVDVSTNTIYLNLIKNHGSTPILSFNSTSDPTKFDMTQSSIGKIVIQLDQTDTTLILPGRWVLTMWRIDGTKKFPVGTLDVWSYNDSDSWSWAEVGDYITSGLGGGVVDVELTSKQLYTCIRASVDEYSRVMPLMRPCILNSPKTGIIDLTEIGYGRGLLDVRVDAGFDFASGFGWSTPVAIGSSQNANTALGGTSSELLVELGYLEQLRETVGADFEWEWNAPKLFVQNVPKNRVFVIIVDDHTLQTIPTNDREWINKFSQAKAKQIIGNMRNKYPQISTPGGGTSMNGDSLIQQGREDELSLLEELRRKRADDPLMWG